MTADATGTNASSATETNADPITKIGTEVFGLRVISGYVHHAEPDTIVLRQLYPGRPANIGHLDATGPDPCRVTIAPSLAGEWTGHDRSALATFFRSRYADRYRTLEHRADLLEATDDRAA